MAALIRFLVSDVDGTLVTPDKTVTQAARDAVAELLALGAGFALVSSRPPRGLAAVIAALDLAKNARAGMPIAAAFNGGIVFDAAMHPLEQHTLAAADARAALAVLAEFDIDAWLFTASSWIATRAEGAYVTREQKTLGFAPQIVASFARWLDEAGGMDNDVADNALGKIVGSSSDFAKLARCQAAMATRLSPDAKALLSQPYYLDVTHTDANKGEALKSFARHAGVAIAEVAAIGDMSNDLAMLDIAGFSIAMGNAPDAVKANVDAVTSANSDEGFAKAVREFILPRLATREGMK